MRLLALGAAALAGAVASGCGSHEDVAFKAPAGWTSTPSLFGTQAFMKPGDASKLEMIVVTHSLEMIVVTTHSLPDPATGAGAATLTDITICGDHPAKLIHVKTKPRDEGTSHAVKPQLLEGVTTKWNGQTVTAMYARPDGTAADPAAEAAIRSICSASK